MNFSLIPRNMEDLLSILIGLAAGILIGLVLLKTFP